MVNVQNVQDKRGEVNVTCPPLLTADSFANECVRRVNQYSVNLQRGCTADSQLTRRSRATAQAKKRPSVWKQLVSAPVCRFIAQETQVTLRRHRFGTLRPAEVTPHTSPFVPASFSAQTVLRGELEHIRQKVLQIMARKQNTRKMAQLKERGLTSSYVVWVGSHPGRWGSSGGGWCRQGPLARSRNWRHHCFLWSVFLQFYGWLNEQLVGVIKAKYS